MLRYFGAHKVLEVRAGVLALVVSRKTVCLIDSGQFAVRCRRPAQTP